MERKKTSQHTHVESNAFKAVLCMASPGFKHEINWKWAQTHTHTHIQKVVNKNKIKTKMKTKGMWNAITIYVSI